MSEQVVVVTGSSRGLGFGLAEALLARGCKVVVSGRAPDEAGQRLAARHAAEQVLAVRADVTVFAGCLRDHHGAGDARRLVRRARGDERRAGVRLRGSGRAEQRREAARCVHRRQRCVLSASARQHARGERSSGGDEPRRRAAEHRILAKRLRREQRRPQRLAGYGRRHTFDFGDGACDITNGYGSMQIHNTAERRTIFAFNSWGDSARGAFDLGIGAAPSGHPDFTFLANAGAFSLRTLEVIVDAPAALGAPIGAGVEGPPAAISARVPAADLEGYRLVYRLDIPRTARFNVTGTPYAINNAAAVPPGSFDRVAWFMELDSAAGLQWIWVSARATTLDAARIGVPDATVGVMLHQALVDGRVVSNVVTERDGVDTLYAEFWPLNYQTANALPVPGARDDAFDFGDRPSPGNYASMQIHDAASGETLFAYNHWGDTGSAADLGIGPSPSGNTDWTFRANAGDYSARTLFVLVRALVQPPRP
jgi:hypothetical protein